MKTEKNNPDRYRFRVSLLHPKYWATWLGLSVFFIVTLLPAPIVDWLGERIGMIAAKKNQKRFNIAKRNLSLCYPEKNATEIEEMTYANFRAQFRSLLHYYILWWRPDFVLKKKIKTEGFELVSQYRQQGKEIIILVPHFVGLEFSVAAISMNFVANGPYKKIRNPVIDWIVVKGRTRFGDKKVNRLFTRDDGLRPLIRETRAGKVLIYLADEDLGIENAIFTPFFGVQKATVSVLGRLAQSCRAVVLTCVCCYDTEKRRYSIKLMPAIEGMPSGDDAEDTLLMNKALECAIGHCPDQYLWTLKYFKTRPPGEESLYD